MTRLYAHMTRLESVRFNRQDPDAAVCLFRGSWSCSQSIELRTLEAMLEQQAPPRPPALEPKSNDASEANELGVFAEQSEASGSEESSDKQPASDPTVPFWWSPPAAR